MKGKEYFVLVFPVVGAILVGMGIWYRRRLTKRIRSWTRTTGCVLQFEQRSSFGSMGSPDFHYPVIQFRANGREVCFEDCVGSGKPCYVIGDTLDIVYDPTDPSSARILKTYYVLANGILGIGSGFLLLGSLMTYLLVRGV
jgi:hypothetical protein